MHWALQALLAPLLLQPSAHLLLHLLVPLLHLLHQQHPR
jgi:hypothetical protein